MTTRITIPSQKLTIARAFAASKDPRTKIKGVHLNFTENRIEATNGILAVCIPHDFGVKHENIIYRIPKGNLEKVCEIDLTTDTLTITEGKMTSGIKGYVLERIDGEFVDLSRTIPKPGRELTCGDWCVNASFLALAAKALPKNTPIRVMVSGKSDVVEIRPSPEETNLKGVRIFAMPMRHQDF